MFSIADFIQKYETYSDEELFEIHNNQEGYSAESLEAMNAVMKKRGGLDKLFQGIKEKQIIEAEVRRIEKETESMGSQHIDASFIKTITTSNILSAEKVNEIIDNKHAEIELEMDDKKIKPRTIVMGIVGGSVASVTGGILWGLQMIYSNAIFTMLFIGLIILCYGIIKIATRQSYKNIIVIIATVISVVLALLIGELLYQVIGYQE